MSEITIDAFRFNHIYIDAQRWRTFRLMAKERSPEDWDKWIDQKIFEDEDD
jgi:hypothetical protein